MIHGPLLDHNPPSPPPRPHCLGVNLAMAAGGWWVENRERTPPLDTASRGWGVNGAESPCGQKY